MSAIILKLRATEGAALHIKAQERVSFAVAALVPKVVTAAVARTPVLTQARGEAI